MASVPSTTGLDLAQMPDAAQRRKINVLVVSSVALAFISFWRAAAIVLCDLASTAYYIGGISEQAVGKAAPWFILGVMLFSYAVRAVYVESCTMFTRGGVYRVVKEAMGGSLAKLSVSALMFDYILTGPISAVSAGQYLVGLVIDMLNVINRWHGHAPIDPTHYQGTVNFVCVLLAIGITLYFWRLNIKGIHESSDKALRIMQLTTVMGIIIIGWSVLTMVVHRAGLHVPPLHPVFSDSSHMAGRNSSKGWLEGWPRLIGTLGVLIAFGHTLLAMSGEESLAQVNREIEAPKLKNLLRAGFVIFLYSLLLTSIISFFAVLIIPDGMRVQTQVVVNGHKADNEVADYLEVDYLRGKDAQHPGEWGYIMHRSTDDHGETHIIKTNDVKVVDRRIEHVERDNGGYRDNLINGLVQFLVGPSWLKITMEIFVVVVGFLILAGAVNTSIVGSNGVLNRIAEDGVLTPWFLHPQKRFGTTHRLINLVAILQLVTIVASWGDVNTLGEAYAFGVIWSFVFKTLAMVVLRFKDKSPRLYEVPFNIRIHKNTPGSPGDPVLAAKSAHEASGTAGVVTAPLSQEVPADGSAPKPALPVAGAPLPKHAQIDLPVGIFVIFLVLFSTAVINLATKETATIWGIAFTVFFLIAFIILEQISHRRRGGGHHAHLEQFNQKSSETMSAEALDLKYPGPIVVAVRGPRSLPMLERVLKETDTSKKDVVVLTCKVLKPRTSGITELEQNIDDDDRDLLTKVVTVTEEVGKEVHPMVLPTNNPLYGIAMAARDLKAEEVVLGVSESVHAEMQLEQFALAWGTATADPQYAGQQLKVRILGPQVEVRSEME